MKDHGEALPDKFPISTVVSCEGELSDDDDLGSSKSHGFGLWGDHDNTLEIFVGKRINHFVNEHGDIYKSDFNEILRNE